MKNNRKLNLHENFQEKLPPPPKPRSTGIVISVFIALVAWFGTWNNSVAIGLFVCSGVLFAAALVAPKMLNGLNSLWFKFSLLLSKVMNPIFLGVMYYLIIVPAGLIFQLFKDPLVKRKKDEHQSYWIICNADENSVNMKNPY